MDFIICCWEKIQFERPKPLESGVSRQLTSYDAAAAADCTLFRYPIDTVMWSVSFPLNWLELKSLSAKLSNFTCLLTVPLTRAEQIAIGLVLFCDWLQSLACVHSHYPTTARAYVCVESALKSTAKKSFFNLCAYQPTTPLPSEFHSGFSPTPPTPLPFTLHSFERFLLCFPHSTSSANCRLDHQFLLLSTSKPPGLGDGKPQ